MSEITKCQSCKGDFDSQDKVPMLLPCGHNVCYDCANEKYKKNRFIKCDLQNCQKVHQIRQYQLQEDNKLIQQLEQKILQGIISKLKSQEANLSKAQKELSEQQSNIIYKLIKHLNDYVLKDNIAMQKELKKINKNIKLQLNYYQQQLQNINQKVKAQNNLQQSQMSSQTEKKSISLIDESQQIKVKLSKLTINVYEELENQKNLINEVNKENVDLKKKITEYKIQIEELKFQKQRNDNSISTQKQKEEIIQKQQRQHQQSKFEKLHLEKPEHQQSEHQYTEFEKYFEFEKLHQQQLQKLAVVEIPESEIADQSVPDQQLHQQKKKQYR